jgi:hypothetical protein
MGTESQPLTRKSFIDMTPEQLRELIHNPEKLAEANAILDGSIQPTSTEAVTTSGEVVKTPEESAAEAEAAQLAAQQAADAAKKIQDDEATAAKTKIEAEYKAAGIQVENDANGNIVSIVMNYQARDEAGNPIGRPTYLKAKTWFDLTVQQRAAHENAVRFAERVKKQKATIKKDDPNAPKQLSETELVQLQEELKGENRDKAAEAAQKIREHDAQKAIKDALEAKASFEFLSSHLQDYNHCEANNKLLAEFVRGNNLEWTKENLEVALTALESQLAPKEEFIRTEQLAPTAPANPASVAPVTVVPPPATVTQPAQQVAQNTTTLPAPRPGVNSGIVPGQTSAQRPSGQPRGLTKDDIRKMPREEYRRRLKDPKFEALVNATLQAKT